MTLQLLGFVWLGAFVGAFAVGAAGFAFALAATALWLHVLDPLRATLLVAACGTLLHVGLIWRIRETIEPARVSPFIVSGLVGVPIGVYVLTRVDTQALKIALGVFLLAYGLYALVMPRLPHVKAGGRAVYQPFILVMQIATLAAAGFVALDRFSLELIGVAVPALLLGAWLGWLAFGRLDEIRD